MVFKELASDWDSLSATEKLDLFNGTNYEQATVADIKTIKNKFKVLKYSDISEQLFNSVQVNAVPNDSLVLPNSLFGKSFSSIKSMKITESVTGSGKIRYIFSKDLTNFFTFKNFNWVKISDLTTNAVLAEGLSASSVGQIPAYSWSKFYTSADAGLSIGFAFSETDISQITAIDELSVVADIKGSWSSAVCGTDYTIKYSDDSTMKVDLLQDGSYKINYL